MRNYSKLSVILLIIIFIYCGETDKNIVSFEDGTELNNFQNLPFKVYQNYPNPFKNTTVIQLQLQKKMYVKI